MIAECIASGRIKHIVNKVLPSMKDIDSMARYYALIGGNVVLFLEGDVSDKSDEWLYNINGKLHSWLGTGDIDYFMKVESIERQLTIFD